jgi:hypothetical protein
MNDAERLRAILDHADITPPGFAKSIGMSNPTALYYVLNGRNELSKAMQKDILQRYPVISPGWLATGTGLMFLQESEIPEPEPIQYTQDDIRNLIMTVKALSEKVEELLKKKDL